MARPSSPAVRADVSGYVPVAIAVVNSELAKESIKEPNGRLGCSGSSTTVTMR